MRTGHTNVHEMGGWVQECGGCRTPKNMVGVDSTTFILLHLHSHRYTANRIWRVRRGGTAQANSYIVLPTVPPIVSTYRSFILLNAMFTFLINRPSHPTGNTYLPMIIRTWTKFFVDNSVRIIFSS